MKKSIADIVPWRVRIHAHRIYHDLKYFLGVHLLGHDPLIPPGSLHDVGGPEFVAVGEQFFGYFVDLYGLQPHHSVLDVGCGTGRMARPLTRYLKTGHYDGIDIVGPSIRWCQEVYTRQYPNFQFHWTDLYNKYYTAKSKTPASEYRFPFDTASFDFVFLTSVFTHLLPPDLENYLSEVARVLKPQGRCLITYYLLNPAARKLIDEGASGLDFKYELPGCFVRFIETPEAAVAYHENFVRSTYARHRLEISEPIRYGLWCGRPDGMSWQDLVFARKTL